MAYVAVVRLVVLITESACKAREASQLLITFSRLGSGKGESDGESEQAETKTKEEEKVGRRKDAPYQPQPKVLDMLKL